MRRRSMRRGTPFVRAAQVRAYDDRAIGSFARNSYVSTLCPPLICPYLCTSEFEEMYDSFWSPRVTYIYIYIERERDITYACIYIYIYIYTHVYIYVYIYIYIEREREILFLADQRDLDKRGFKTADPWAETPNPHEACVEEVQNPGSRNSLSPEEFFFAGSSRGFAKVEDHMA